MSNDVSMRDVARAAGVSVAVVSRSINNRQGQVAEETRHKVLDVCEKLGYKLNPDNFHSETFLDCCLRKIREKDIPADPSLIFNGRGHGSGITEELKKLLLRPELPFDGLICQNYRCASQISWLLGVRLGLYRRQDVTIATSQPSSYDRLAVPAIYYKAVMRQSAGIGVSMLVDIIHDKHPPGQQIELPTETFYDPGILTKKYLNPKQ